MTREELYKALLDKRLTPAEFYLRWRKVKV